MAMAIASSSVVVLAAVVCCTLLLLLAPSSSSGAEPAPLSSGSYEDDRLHDFLRVLDRAAAYRRECFGQCAKGCYCAENPYSCLRECMPTLPTRRCGATYDVVQGVFSSSATFTSSSSSSRPETADASGDGFFASAT